MSTVKTFIKQGTMFMRKNAHVFLTIGNATALISAPILAATATPKAMEKLHDLRAEKRHLKDDPMEELTPVEAFKGVWKCYAPAAGVALTGVGCLIGLNKTYLRRTAALASLYSVSESALRAYQEKVVEQIGANKEQRIRDAVATDDALAGTVGGGDLVPTGNGTMLCYDGLAGREFYSDIETIRRVVNDINEELIRDTYVRLSDLYWGWGMTGTELGDSLGWDIQHGLIEVHFTSMITEKGAPALVINFKEKPRLLW